MVNDDYLYMVVFVDSNTIPEFIDTKLVIHKNMYKQMSIIFSLFLYVIDDGDFPNKSVASTVLDKIDNCLMYIKKYDDVSDNMLNYISNRFNTYKQICLEEEFYEYSSLINEIIKLI